MEGQAIDAAQEELITWGLLERDVKGIAWSRRFRGAVMRAAARLAEAERAGEAPEGPPLANAVRAALEDGVLPPDARATPLHEQVLVAVELAALPDVLRGAFGG